MCYDLIVVGAGPAGMTAALYAARAGKRVMLFEGETPGGQIITSRKIENYPALPEVDGYTFSQNLILQVRALGVSEISAFVEHIEKRDGMFIVYANGAEYKSLSVILATGLAHRKLGVEGEEQLLGKGISFCATCDGMFFRKKEVAVIGGGNTAVQDALILSDICEKVYLIHRRDTLRAEEELINRMNARENIVFLKNTVVERFLGDGRLSGVALRNVQNDDESELLVSGVFEAIGQIPRNEAFRALVPTDENGYFITDRKGATAREGIFAAGDACQKEVRQLTTAVADGTVAALSAVAYINEQRGR